MARIPDDEIQRLKKEILVEHLAAARGVELTRSGDNLIGLCPLHPDKSLRSSSRALREGRGSPAVPRQ